MAPRTVARVERRWRVRLAPLPAGVEAFRTAEALYVRVAPRDTVARVERRCSHAAAYYAGRVAQ